MESKTGKNIKGGAGGSEGADDDHGGDDEGEGDYKDGDNLVRSVQASAAGHWQ